MIFQHRLMGSAWDITDTQNECKGFSGTNDSSLLLPLNVEQKMSNSKELDATNGKNLHIIIKKSQYCPIEMKEDENKLDKLIDFINYNKIDCLIDVGALFVDFRLKNEEFIDYLLKNLKHYDGVVYFDNEWKYKNKEYTWSLINSPKKEKDSFVFFDQRRCRGADLILKSNAKGVITTSQNLKKDDLMQACGRMR
jgi:hypothetical protein